MNIRATAVRILCADLFADLPAGGSTAGWPAPEIFIRDSVGR
jgi:hypothetical protein